MQIWLLVYPTHHYQFASGYLEESHLPYEMGLVKNQYVARTFIQPTQELREQGVRVKLSAVKDIVEGKRIVLVDDSIVRGTTSKRIVRMLKDSGAKEVHVRIASPEFMFPSFYGIDVSTTALNSFLQVSHLKKFVIILVQTHYHI